MAGPKRISDDRSPSPTIRELDDRDSDVTETSQLLSPQDSGASKNGWDNDVDFQHLPWWRRPSVRLALYNSSAECGQDRYTLDIVSIR